MQTKLLMLELIKKPSLYWLLLLAPLAFYLEHTHASPVVIFFTAAFSILPIAKGIVHFTEQVAHHTSASIGALLNATFGNAPEMMIAFFALYAGKHVLVLGSIAGAILANLLLALGISFIVGGIKYREQKFNIDGVRTLNSVMLVAVLSMMISSAFEQKFSETAALINVHTLNISVAILLLITYVGFLWFMLKTHSSLFETIPAEGDHKANTSFELNSTHLSLNKSIVGLVLCSVAAAFISELLVGVAEETGQRLGMSEAFVGLILVAVVGGAAESFSAISLARSGRIDMSLAIALGSCVQIALFVAPILILLSYFVGPHPMDLIFNRGEMAAVFAAVLLTIMLVSDGRSNWFKGVQLLVLYFIMAMLFYVMPS